MAESIYKQPKTPAPNENKIKQILGHAIAKHAENIVYTLEKRMLLISKTRPIT